MSSRTIGFEIETNLTVDDMLPHLEDVIRSNGKHQLTTREEHDNRWNLKSEHCGSEITSPVMNSTEEDLEHIKDVIETLRRRICRTEHNIIDRHCGLHVHIGLNDFNLVHLRNLYLIVYHFEDVLFSLQPSSREDNDYVNHLKNEVNIDDVKRQRNFGSNSPYRDHYLGLNVEGWMNRKTCEFRYASSTIRHQKLLNWIKLLVCLVECARSKSRIIDCLMLERDYPVTIDGLSTFMRSHTFTKSTWLQSKQDELKTWMTNRIQELRTRDDS
jgi:hypothetical protein